MLTLYRIKKMKKLSMNFLSEMNDRKESEEGNIFQNKCALVSSQNRRNKKRRGRHRSVVTYLPSTQRAASLQAGPAASPRKHSTLQESPIKYHKCPTFVKRDF